MEPACRINLIIMVLNNCNCSTERYMQDCS